MGPDTRRRNRIAICHCGRGRDTRLRTVLERAGFDVLTCRTPEALIERAVQSRPALIGYKIGPVRPMDVGVLRLLRRLAPDAPFLIVSKGATLEARRLVQELRPIFLLLEPWSEDELSELITSLTAPRSPRAFHPAMPARGAR